MQGLKQIDAALMEVSLYKQLVKPLIKKINVHNVHKFYVVSTVEEEDISGMKF